MTIFAGIPLAVALRHFTLTLSASVVLALDLSVLVLFTLLLSQTLSSAALALYERGDLDLLLSSPLPPGRILGARAFVIAVSPLTIFLSLLCPMVIPLALFGHPQWLGAIAVLVALGFAASATGLAVAMGLFSLIGPKRTRTAGQLLAAFIGAALFLAGQARYLFAQHMPFASTLFSRLSRSGIFQSGSPLSFPARAVLGEPVPLAAFCLGSAGVFWLTTRTLGARFAKDAAIAGGPAFGARRGAQKRLRFRSGATSTLVRKELKLLARDPALLSQVLLRILYLLPLAFILLQNTKAHFSGRIASGAGALAFVASQVSASLAWITISAEDAPDLLRSSPVSARRVRRAKLLAALLPVAFLLAAPVLLLAWISPAVGAIEIVSIAASTASAALLNLWYESPGKRNLFRRRGTGSLTGNLAVLAMGLAWSATTSLAVLKSPWTVVALLASLALLGLFYRWRSAGGSSKALQTALLTRRG
ncbi:MAG: hypothetical protein JOZ55_11395 [Alphaproteobacteria bacterium]|nr:hypothetical protein [Alphaproteobacteria bacterium]